MPLVDKDFKTNLEFYNPFVYFKSKLNLLYNQKEESLFRYIYNSFQLVHLEAIYLRLSSDPIGSTY